MTDNQLAKPLEPADRQRVDDLLSEVHEIFEAVVRLLEMPADDYRTALKELMLAMDHRLASAGNIIATGNEEG